MHCREICEHASCTDLHMLLTFGIVWKVYYVWLKKTRTTKFVPHYFTFHDNANIKAALKQNQSYRLHAAEQRNNLLIQLHREKILRTQLVLHNTLRHSQVTRCRCVKFRLF